jgi:hypothetical protein
MTVSVDVPATLFVEAADDHHENPEDIVGDALRLWVVLENPHEMIIARRVEEDGV